MTEDEMAVRSLNLTRVILTRIYNECPDITFPEIMTMLSMSIFDVIKISHEQFGYDQKGLVDTFSDSLRKQFEL